MFFTLLNLVSFATVMSVLWCFRSCSRWIAVPVSVLLTAGLLKIPVFVYFGGNLFSPVLPRPAVIFFSWCTGFLWTVFVLVLLLGAAHIVPAVRRSGETFRRISFPFVFLAAAAMVCLTGYNALRQPELIKVHEFKPDDHAFSRPMKVIHLSDLHISSMTDERWIDDLIVAVNAQKPDLIILGGDIADGTVSARSPAVDRLMDLKSSKGVVLVPGNHEYYIDYRGWMNLYRSMHFYVLENGIWSFRYEDTVVDVIGLTDEEAGRHGLPVPKIEHLMSKNAEKDSRIRILVKHRPKNLDKMIKAEYGIRLAVSGHTHGGMVPFIKPLAASLNSGYCRGVYRIADTILYVSDGTFLWNGFPFRLGSRNVIAEFIFEG